ncbi:hypothetical protein GCM10009863_54360 [Streptomyces axinellae]|uniref:Uncharacterized protein n=1 Tax=Streptomyces axinellae TaxID=552788 RepID=A0ABN3QP73_9ACTN
MLRELTLELCGFGRGVHQCLDGELVAGTGPAARHGVRPHQWLLRRYRIRVTVVGGAGCLTGRGLHRLDAGGLRLVGVGLWLVRLRLVRRVRLVGFRLSAVPAAVLGLRVLALLLPHPLFPGPRLSHVA